MAFDSVSEVVEPFSFGARKRKRCTAGLKLYVSRDEVEGDIFNDQTQFGIWRTFFDLCLQAPGRRHRLQYGDHGTYRWSIRVEDVDNRYSRFVEIKSSQGERFVASLYPAYYPNAEAASRHLDHRFTVHASSDSMLMMGLMMADAIG